MMSMKCLIRDPNLVRRNRTGLYPKNLKADLYNHYFADMATNNTDREHQN
jgi:hypothetical protein